LSGLTSQSKFYPLRLICTRLKNNETIDIYKRTSSSLGAELGAHEHIYWDQASVLAQIGLIDSNRLPITGIEQTERLLEVSNK
jgi:hypothetical protein